MTSNPTAGSNEQRVGAGRADMSDLRESPLACRVGVLKRAEDLVLGSIIVAFVAFPMIAIALAIKVFSGGPICFRQRRYGLGGKPVRTLRFRTTDICGAVNRGLEARRDDSPVSTGLGRFLRRTSLDELPQLLQVISGEMSLVGPSPHAAVQNDEYRSLVDGHPLPPVIKPGITGWAQVNGWRGQTEEPGKMQKRVQYDLEYIRDWSLLWDLKILFRSVLGTKRQTDAS